LMTWKWTTHSLYKIYADVDW